MTHGPPACAPARRLPDCSSRPEDLYLFNFPTSVSFGTPLIGYPVGTRVKEGPLLVRMPPCSCRIPPQPKRRCVVSSTPWANENDAFYAAAELPQTGRAAACSTQRGCSAATRETIRRGRRGLSQQPSLPPGRSRKKGGRKACLTLFPDLDAAFLDIHVESPHTAGDPMRAGVLWTNLSLRRLRHLPGWRRAAFGSASRS